MFVRSSEIRRNCCVCNALAKHCSRLVHGKLSEIYTNIDNIGMCDDDTKYNNGSVCCAFLSASTMNIARYR